MSLVFSNSALKSGIVERIDKTVKSNSSSYPLADKVSDINSALDDALALIFRAGGTWQFDDNNHTDYPIIRTNIISGQRDYSFVDDENGNLILDIYKVVVYDNNGNGREIIPVDAQTSDRNGEWYPNYISDFYNGQSASGTPSRYDKTANAIFLDYIPNYSRTNGLEVYINREGSYFDSADTTKKPGFAGLFHEYLVLKPAYRYARDNSLPNADRLLVDIAKMEAAMSKYYGQRQRDVIPRLIARISNNR